MNFLILLSIAFSSLSFAKRYEEPSILSTSHSTCQSDEPCEFKVYFDLKTFKKKKKDAFVFRIKDNKANKYLYMSDNNLDKIIEDYPVINDKIIFTYTLSNNEEGISIGISFFNKARTKKLSGDLVTLKTVKLGLQILKKNDSKNDPVGFYSYFLTGHKIYKTSSFEEEVGKLVDISKVDKCESYGYGLAIEYKVDGKTGLETYDFTEGNSRCKQKLLEVYGVSEDWIKLKYNKKFVFLKRDKFRSTFKPVHEQLSFFISELFMINLLDETLKEKKKFEDYEQIARMKNTYENREDSFVNYAGLKMPKNIRLPSLKFIDYKYVKDELYLKLDFHYRCGSNEDAIGFYNKLFKDFKWVKYRDLKMKVYGSC